MIKYAELLELLDWNRIVEAAHTVPLKLHDYEDVLQMVMKSVKRWGPADSQGGLRDAVIEERFVLEAYGMIPHLGVTSEESRSYGSSTVKGFIDLRGVRPDGTVEVVDWKSTGSITPEKRAALSISWQGRIYATAAQAQRYTYRLVERSGACSEVSVPWPNSAYCEVDVSEYLDNVIYRRKRMHEWISPWPRSMPYACGAYGRDCNYVDECARHNQSGARPLVQLGPLSHSSIEVFNLCPERYRLDEVTKALGQGQDRPEDDGSQLGSSFHAAIAEAWRQLGKL